MTSEESGDIPINESLRFFPYRVELNGTPGLSFVTVMLHPPEAEEAPANQLPMELMSLLDALFAELPNGAANKHHIAADGEVLAHVGLI